MQTDGMIHYEGLYYCNHMGKIRWGGENLGLWRNPRPYRTAH